MHAHACVCKYKTITCVNHANLKHKNNLEIDQKNTTKNSQLRSYYCEINIENLRICKTINLK